jgi:hypothetical protein
MAKLTSEGIAQMLIRHKHWICEDCDGWEDMRAYLRYAYLRDADLMGANLRDAYLRDADLRDADLRGADLRGAYLRGADLRGADLRGAYLRGADLRGAYLRGADLRDADLRGADLRDAKDVPFVPMACPDTGSFVGWKKADGGLIVKLLIPEDARRSSATRRKCRCDKAKVLAIENPDGTASSVTRVASIRDPGFFYTVGETVKEPYYCTDRFNECAEGIHFFISRQEAVDYYM